jgi:glucokinase
MEILGLDVGGTKVAGGIVSFPGATLRWRQSQPTRPERGGEAVLDDVVALAASLIGQAEVGGAHVDGIGLGVCELVDLAGNITSGQTLRWQGSVVQKRLESLRHTLVEADVRAAALAEAAFGAGKPFDIFLYITVGSGISHALVQAGRPYAGAHGNALLSASGSLALDCPQCHAHTEQVVEEIASGPGMVALYNRLTSRHVTRAEEIVAAAADNDSHALHVLSAGGKALGNVAAFLVNVLDPEAIIIGGGLGLSGGLYGQNLESSTRKYIWHEGARNLPILRASLGVDAGIIGAAAAAWQRLECRHA